MLIHAAAFNLGLVLRAVIGFGTPGGLQEAASALADLLHGLTERLQALVGLSSSTKPFFPRVSASPTAAWAIL